MKFPYSVRTETGFISMVTASGEISSTEAASGETGSPSGVGRASVSVAGSVSSSEGGRTGAGSGVFQ